MTCSAPAAATSSSSRARLPGRSQTRCVSPRHGPSGANVTRCGSVASGIASAADSASMAWSRPTPLRSNASAVRAADSPPGLVKNRARWFWARSAKIEIAARIHVVDGHEQLAESWLPEVLGDELDIAASELDRRRRRQRRGAPNQIPELGAAALEQRRRRERAADQPAGEAVTRAALGAAREGRRHDAGRRRHAGDEDREHGQPRHVGRHRAWARRASRSSGCRRRWPRSRPIEADEGQQHAGRGRSPWPASSRTIGSARMTPAPARAQPAMRERPPPPVETSRRRPPPDAVVVPEPRPAVHRGEHRADDARAAPGDQIDLDPGLVQRAQHAGLVGPGSPRPGQHQGRPQPRRVLAIRSVGVITGRNAESVTLQLRTFIVDRQELHDLEALAAVRGRDRHLVALFFREQGAADRRGGRDQAEFDVRVFRHHERIRDRLPVGILEVHGRPEADLVARQLVQVHQRDVADALLQQADPRLDEALPLLRGVILRVLAQIAELARALNFLRQLCLQFPVQSVDLVLELLQELRLHLD